MSAYVSPQSPKLFIELPHSVLAAAVDNVIILTGRLDQLREVLNEALDALDGAE